MPALLVLASDPHDRFLPVPDLERNGFEVQGVVTCGGLLQQALRKPPDAIVAWQPQVDPALFKAVAQLQATAPCAVLAFTNEVQIESFERALEAGISAWVVQGYAPHRLRPLVLQAQSRFRQEQAARESLAEMNRRYEERTWVDRAKGVLMRARGLTEDEAHRLLRQASMAAKQRVGLVARQVIEVGRDAEAVNRAGQLRMLSQRLVKLHALRLTGTLSDETAALQAQSLQRAEESLAHLRRSLSLPTFGDLVDQVQQGFDGLRAALAAPPGPASLAAVDDAAEAWLEQADRLTTALERAGSSAPLHIVNLAGRQRMLSQRLAKQWILGVLSPPDRGRDSGPSAREPGEARGTPGPALRTSDGASGAEDIEREIGLALGTLRALPLSSPAIATLLDEADGAMGHLKTAVRLAGPSPGYEAIARSSEALLAVFEALTQAYEQGLQCLTGEGAPYAISRPAN